MHAVAVTALGALAGFVFLELFYLAVRTEWPTSYVSLETDFGVIVNRSVGRYLLFMAAPIYCVSLISSTTVGRNHGNQFLTALLIGIGHAVFASLRNAWLSMKRRTTSALAAVLILDLLTSVVVISASLLGGLGPGSYGFVVPGMDEFFKSLWTTAAVAIIAVCLLHLTRNRNTVDKMVRRSRREVGDLEAYAREQSGLVGADADLVSAVLLTENLQRPRWVRALERIKGRVFHQGSYGVMQVTSSKPVSDSESIAMALSGPLGEPLPEEQYGPGYEAITARLAAHNDNPRFIDLASQIYYAIYTRAGHPEPAEASPEEQSERRVALGLRLVRALSDRYTEERFLPLLLTADIDSLEYAATALESLPIPYSQTEQDLAATIRQRLRQPDDPAADDSTDNT
jgi:hypothetical protein